MTRIFLSLARRFATVQLMLLCGFAMLARAQDSDNISASILTNGSAAPADSPSMDTLQEVLRTTHSLIEQTLRQSELAVHSADTIALRLDAIEKGVAARDRQIEMTQRANDHLIQIIGAVAGIGILAVALMAYFQWRAVTRLAAIAEQLPERLALHSPRMHTALESGSPTHVSGGLLEAVDRIERRIRELEHTTPFAVSDVKSDKNEHENHQGGVQTSRVSLLIEKGQSHLDLNEADSAIACLDEALELEPANANALVKKGTALERLQRFDEALTCYNRAIAAEDSTTMAYLCKGAVLNRLQRYGEALECYEQALRTQQKAA